MRRKLQDYDVKQEIMRARLRSDQLRRAVELSAPESFVKELIRLNRQTMNLLRKMSRQLPLDEKTRDDVAVARLLCQMEINEARKYLKKRRK